MAFITIDASEVEELGKRMERNIKAVPRIIRLQMLKSLNDIENEVIPKTPTNTGKLRQSVDSRILGQRLGNLVGEVGSPLPYAQSMESGYKSSKMPNLKALELWVIRKQIDTPPQSKSTAFLIGRAIAEGRSKGIANTGVQMFEEGFRDAWPTVRKDWERITPNKIAAKVIS